MPPCTAPLGTNTQSPGPAPVSYTHLEEALIKLLNLSLVANSNSTSDKAVFEGKDLAKNGASIFYLPVYMYYATPWHDYRERIWNAYETKDDSGLITDVEREWYGYMCDWMEDGLSLIHI